MTYDNSITRYTTAKGYIMACRVIFYSKKYSEEYVPFILPIHMLAAFALELYLKSWLLKSELHPEKVKKLGHNLSEIYKTANEFSLPKIEGVKELVDHFHKPHSDFTYRYMNEYDNLSLVNWPSAFTVFNNLDYEVDLFVGASASHGLQRKR